ncbi:hypothetical protein [Synechocystis sp. LKSZ1]|uniref:hypothetical protein n=1 Tax=Synechocystis sp. LKSZ1 TaxID=3144951 RepID=UPI00336BD49C
MNSRCERCRCLLDRCYPDDAPAKLCPECTRIGYSGIDPKEILSRRELVKRSFSKLDPYRY